jgi:hypothetical protein
MFVASIEPLFNVRAYLPQAEQTYTPGTRVQVPSFTECSAFGSVDGDLEFFIYPKTFFMSTEKSNQNGDAHATLTRKLEQKLTEFFTIVTATAHYPMSGECSSTPLLHPILKLRTTNGLTWCSHTNALKSYCPN